MELKSLGIVGLGAFGMFFMEQAKEHAPWLKLFGWDNNKASPNSLEEVLGCDAVVFAVPPVSYIRTLTKLVPRMPQDSIIIDVCTVKMVTTEAVRGLAAGRPYIATHPMFGLQSWLDAKGSLKGMQLVVCEHTLPEKMYAVIERFLKQRVGLDVVHMTPEEHDEAQAEEQLLTQHIGAAIARTGFKLNEHRVHTVSAKYFYRAMAIVANDGALFKQASALNPFWPKALARYELAEAEHNLDRLTNGK